MQHSNWILAFVALALIGCGGGASGGDGGTGGGTGGGATGGGGGTAGFACTTGALFAGNPLHPDPMQRPSDGTGLLEDPPFAYRTVVFSQGQVITHNGQEIWRASLTDKRLHKIAGTESGQALITGPCANARFSNIFHLVLASDGSLFVSDQTANTILKITDPLGAGCTVSHFAGTPMDIQPGIINPNNPPNVGNVEGPGASAKFGLPERMAIDSNGNLYVWDNGNNSVRKITSAGVVSTLVTNIGGPGGGAVMSETFLANKLYVWGKSGNDLFLSEFDPTTGARRDLVTGRADKFGGNSSDSQSLGGLVNDGTALILFFNGQLFRVTTAGAVSAPLAGVYRPGLSYSSGYDPKVSRAAALLEVPLSGQIAVAGVDSFLGIDSTNDLYISSTETSGYVLKVDCGP